MPSSAQTSVETSKIYAGIRKEILRIILKFRAHQAPDAPTLASVMATVNRFCRAGRGSSVRYLPTMKLIRDHFARLGVSRTDIQVDDVPVMSQAVV